MPYSGPGLCRTVKTMALSVDLSHLEPATSAATARAVHTVRENSKGCSTISSVETATAVHQNEWQRKLFIRTSGSKSCSSERVAATAVYRSETTARAVQQIHSGGSRQQRLFCCGDINASYQRVQQIFFGAQSTEKICQP